MLRRSGIFRSTMVATGEHRGTLDLAVVYTTKDSMRTIERSIRSVQALARRIVVVDSGSTDGTQATCRSLGADVHEQPWLGYARQKQRSIDLAGDSAWILLLDSDEIVTDELADSIRRAIGGGCGPFDAFWVTRQYWYKHRPLRIAYPDRVLRLFRRGQAAMGDHGSPHDLVETQLPTGRLAGTLRHDSWGSLDDALMRNIAYARMMSRIGTRRGSMAKVVINAPWAFIRSYVLQRGFLDGRRGFEISLVLAVSTAFKHLYRVEAQRDASHVAARR
jgi:glycosyltransferase involved in cell wall biosynthesis